MSRTDNFRKQHEELLIIAGELSKVLNVTSLSKDATPASTILPRLAGKLKIHLAMEDTALYPDLLKHSDPALKAKAQAFNKEMGDIKSVFESYVKKWNGNAAIQSGAADFVKETKGLIDALGQRINRENNDLYQLVDKLM